MPQTLRLAAFFFLRQVRTSLRLPAALSLSFFQPMVWVILFSQLFKSVASLRGLGQSSYLQFLTPGLALMSAVFSASYSGLGILGDISSGLLDKFLAAPVPRGAILLGPLLQTGFQSAVQASVIVATATVLGARMHGGVPAALLLLLVAALLGMAFAALSNGLALATRRQQTLIATVNLVSLPLTFLSSMMMARDLMPRWMGAVAAFNPVDWAVTAARSAFEGHPIAEALPAVGLLALFAFGVWAFAARAFVLYQRSF